MTPDQVHAFRALTRAQRGVDQAERTLDDARRKVDAALLAAKELGVRELDLAEALGGVGRQTVVRRVNAARAAGVEPARPKTVIVGGTADPRVIQP